MNNVEELQSKTIDWLRFPLMVMVVMIHVPLCVAARYSLPVCELTPSAFFHYLFANGICAASVPTFFFISGYLFFSGVQKNTPPHSSYYLAKFKKRLKTIVVPLVIATLAFLTCHYLLLIFRAVHSSMEIPSLADVLNEHGWLRLFWDDNRLAEINHPAKVNIIGVPMHTNFPMLSPMWYLRDLIVIMLLSPLVYYFVTKTKVIGLFVVALLNVLNIWIPLEGFSSTAFLFFSLGAYFKINGKSFLIEFGKYKVVFYIMALLSLFLMLYYHGRNDFVEEVFSRLYIIAGVISILNLSGYLVEKMKISPHSLLSKSSFFIYLYHYIYISGFVVAIVSMAVPFDNQLIIILKYLFSVTLTIVLCVMIYAVMQKLCPKLLSIISGGRN